MPIKLSDIVVDFIEEDDEFDENTRCSLCKEIIELSRANNYKPKEHTLDICLEKVFNSMP